MSAHHRRHKHPGSSNQTLGDSSHHAPTLEGTLAMHEPGMSREAVRNSKHDAIVSAVADRLRQDGYEHIVEHRVYGDAFAKGHGGEIDLLAEADGYAFCFEVKCYDSKQNRESAIDQLARSAVRYFGSRRVFSFFVAGADASHTEPVYHWIPHETLMRVAEENGYLRRDAA